MALALSNQLILQEEYNDQYEPTAEELQEYCGVIGLNPKEDLDLLWIAREGLKAPLPPDWKPVKDNTTEDVYYFNFTTGESTWDHPCDEYYQTLLQEEKAKRGKGTGKVTKKQEKPVAITEQPAKVGMSLAPLKFPGSGTGGLGGGKPTLGPLKGIPPLKNSFESMQPRTSTPSGMKPLVSKAMTGTPVVNDVVKRVGMQLSYEESDDDVSIEIGGKLAEHDIAALGYVESDTEVTPEPMPDRPEIHPMKQKDSFPLGSESESEPDFGLASRLVGLSPELLTPALPQTTAPRLRKPIQPNMVDNSKTVLASQIAQTKTMAGVRSTGMKVVGNMRYEEEEDEDEEEEELSDETRENSEERRVEEARLKAAAAATARASVQAEIAKQDVLHKQELEKANKEHCKELEELKGRFQGEVMRERLRLEQDKEADLNKMRARLNQEKSVAEAKLQRGHSKYLEDMKKKMEEQRNDEEAKLAEEMQEKIRKLERTHEKDESSVHEAHEKQLDALREQLEQMRAAEEKRIREENKAALIDLETELENEKELKRAEIAAGCEEDIEDIRKELQDRKRKVKDDLTHKHDEELAVLQETLTKEHSEAVEALRSQLEVAAREETDKLKEQIEQVQTKAIEDENAMRQQASEDFEKKRAELQEEHKNQIAALAKTHEEKMDEMRKDFTSKEKEERMQLESALEKLRKDCQQAIEDSRQKIKEDRQSLLVAEEQQKQETADLRDSLEQQKQKLAEWKEQLQAEEEELRKSCRHLQQEQGDVAADEQAISERKTHIEKQRLSEEKDRLQAKVKALQQQVLQLTRVKESLEEEIERLSTAHSALLEQQATLVEDQVTAETAVRRPRTSTPARHVGNSTVEVKSDDEQEESQVHDGPLSQERTMHVGELATAETMSSYGVAGVSTVLAEQTGERTLEEHTRQGVSVKQQRKGGRMSKPRQSRRHTEPAKKQTEPIQELAARLAALTSRARGSGKHSTMLRQPATVDLPVSEAESTVDSYLSSLSSMPTRAIITGNSDGDIEHLETQLLRPRGREADVLDINDFTESSETDHDSDGSETSGTQRVNPKALDKGHHKLPANDRIPHQTRDIMSSLRQVNNELTSVLARLPLTETNSVPPPIRMAWTERNYGNQTRYLQATAPDPDDINKRWQRYFGDNVELSRKPAIYRGTTSRWDDSNLRRTLLMLEEQKRWLEEYRQTISPQKPVLSMSSGPEGRTPKFTTVTGHDFKPTATSGLRAGNASRHWSARLELGESGEIRRVPSVARTSSKWNRRL